MAEHIHASTGGRPAIALSVDLTARMQRAGWWYWRIYETRFRRADYQDRFGRDLGEANGRHLRPLRCLGLMTDDGEWIRLSDGSAFWLHECEEVRLLVEGSSPPLLVLSLAAAGGR